MSSAPITKSDWLLQDNLKEGIVGIEKQEKELQFDEFTVKLAETLVEKIFIKIQQAESNSSDKLSALISVRLWTGLTLSQKLYGEGVIPSNEDWARRKANTVRTYGTSSFLLGRKLQSKGKDINSLGQEYAAHGGAFPINIKGVKTGPIGVIIVSGLEQWQDHHVIVEAIKDVLTAQR